MISFLKRHYRKILIWGIGSVFIFLIIHSSLDQPDFILENGIITWHIIWAWIIFLICYALTSKRPFWRVFFQDLEDRVENCEKHLSSYGSVIEKVAILIDKNFEETRDREEILTAKIKDLEKELKEISVRLLDHTSDCFDKWECQGCGEICNGIFISSDGDGICNKCNMPTHFKRIKQSRHKEITTARKAKK